MRGIASVVEKIAACDPDELHISSVTSFELFTGVEKCARPDNERLKVENLIRTVGQLEFDLQAAKTGARIRAELEGRGETIGPYDLLLAGQAMTLGLTLVTNNVREFSRISGLECEDWR
jgi:tRNA(fMet)-specific endonuclease VapC